MRALPEILFEVLPFICPLLSHLIVFPAVCLRILHNVPIHDIHLLLHDLHEKNLFERAAVTRHGHDERPWVNDVNRNALNPLGAVEKPVTKKTLAYTNFPLSISIDFKRIKR